MANLSTVIVPAKVLKGGKHKVRIAVSHNSKTRYIVTDITIDSDKEFKDGRIVKRADAAIKNVKLRGLLDKYQEALYNIDFVEAMSCEELVEHLKNIDRRNRRTIRSVCEEYLSVRDLKPASSSLYRNHLTSILAYLGEDMLMENLNYSYVVGLEKYLRKLGNCSYTIRVKQIFLMGLYTFAQRCMYIQPKVSPWYGYKLPEANVRDAWLTLEEVAAIRDLHIKYRARRIVRDLFMLSYYLGGINIIDLIQVNFNECRRRLIYERTKTENRSKVNKYVEFDMPDEALEIINRYKLPDGSLGKYKVLKTRTFRSTIDYHMKRLAEQVGIQNRLIFYSARKSFAQHALDAGVEQSTIDFILGHKLNTRGTSLFNYIRVTPEIATQAVQKVCTSLRNVVPLQTNQC
jgi:site-specific recombinase XerD